MGDGRPWGRAKTELFALFSRNPESNRLVVELAAPAAADRSLDVGCGVGAAVREAARQSPGGLAVGVDRSPHMLDVARRRSRDLGNVRFEVGAAESLPFPDGTFDVAWTVRTYHHWERPEAGLAEVLRVLAPGGRFLIVEHNASRHGLTPPEAEDVAALMRRLGYSGADVQSHHKELVVTGWAEAAE